MIGVFRSSEIPDEARLLASMPYAVVVLRPELRIASVNAAAENLLGQGARRLIGKPVGNVIDFSEPRLLAMMADSEVQITARDITVRIGKARARRVQVIVAPIVGFAGWQILTLTETTDVEGLEGAGDLDESDSVLRAPEILAHEIKNPLAGIRGAAQLLGRKAKAGERALTKLIAEEVDRIANLINQMQSLSTSPREAPAPLNIHEAIRKARSVIEASGTGAVEIFEEFDPSLPPVLAHGDALMQVLINLMTNALQASQSSEEPVIRVRTRFASGIQLHAQGRAAPIRLPLEIRVSDNGPGIDPALRDHIFEPFVTSKKHGQGLGLALVRKLIRDMNGRITHEREDETGLTHFKIHLPVAEQTILLAGLEEAEA